MTINDFIRARESETYPEPRTPGHDSIIQQVCPQVAARLKPGASVLDVGCGQGPALAWFAAKGFSPHGITTNTEDISACSALGFNVLRMDMHDVGMIAETSYECVFARHVLEHSPIPLYVLMEFARILKPGGTLYVEVPAPDSDCRHENNPNHYSVMGCKMWASLIHRAGFDSVELRGIELTTAAGPDKYFSFIATK